MCVGAFFRLQNTAFSLTPLHTHTNTTTDHPALPRARHPLPLHERPHLPRVRRGRLRHGLPAPGHWCVFLLMVRDGSIYMLGDWQEGGWLVGLLVRPSICVHARTKTFMCIVWVYVCTKPSRAIHLLIIHSHTPQTTDKKQSTSSSTTARWP